MYSHYYASHTLSRRRPSAPKGTRKVAIENRNFAKTLLPEVFDRAKLGETSTNTVATKRGNGQHHHAYRPTHTHA